MPIELPFLSIVYQGQYSAQDSSGLIGLGFPGAKVYESNTFLDSMYEAGLINDKVFMMNINNGGYDDLAGD